MIGAGLGRNPTWIGCPTNIEMTTRMATSTIRYLTTMRIFAGIVVSRSTTYHRMIVAIAISAAEAMSRIKFMVFLHLKVESRPSVNFMPRILEGLNPRRGLVEGERGLVAVLLPTRVSGGFLLRVGHLIFRNARLWKRFSVQSSWAGERATSTEPLSPAPTLVAFFREQEELL